MIVGILLPFSLVYILLIVCETRTKRRESIENAERFLTELTAKHAALCDGHFGDAARVAGTTADFLSLNRNWTAEKIDEMIRRNLASNPEIVGSCAAFEPNAFEAGLELFAPYVCRGVGETELISSDLAVEYIKANEKIYPEWPWYAEIAKNRAKPRTEQHGTWSEPYFDEGGGAVLMCTYSAPFFHEDRFAGVSTVDIALDFITKRLSRIASDGTTYRMLSSRGTFISAPEPALVMKKTIFDVAGERNSSRLEEIGRKMLEGENGIVRYRDFGTDQVVWMAYAPLPSSGWSLMASIPESTVMSPVYEQLFRSVSVFVLVFLTIIGIIVVVSYRITTPIKRLAAFAGDLAGGNLDARVGDVGTRDEIGSLAAAFDRMAADLKTNIESRIREESARKTVEGELRVARRIQASLLPRIFPPFPDRREFELHAMNEPASFIAGDFYDFFFLDKQTLALVMADVSGHGVPAAMFMAVSRTAIRNFSLADKTPREILSKVNDLLNLDNDDMMFVTVFYAHYDVQNGCLTYVNAGHNPPYIVRRDGTLEKLGPTGPLLAAFEGVSYEEGTANLERGDILTMFTDGVTEAHCTEGNVLFGEERLENLLPEIRDDSVDRICDRINEAVERHDRGQRHDDVTLMVLRRN